MTNEKNLIFLSERKRINFLDLEFFDKKQSEIFLVVEVINFT